MSHPPVDPHYSTKLRVHAEALLKSGSAPASHAHHALGAEALAALCRMASSPAIASDCLKILHELQTHQIELDLQQEQNAISEHESARELARYKLFYECAPAGYFIIGREGHILESNTAGAALLGLTCSDTDGCRFDEFLAPDSLASFAWLLKKLFNGTSRETCTVYAAGSDAATPLHVVATRAPDGETVLLMMLPQITVLPQQAHATR